MTIKEKIIDYESSQILKNYKISRANLLTLLSKETSNFLSKNKPEDFKQLKRKKIYKEFSKGLRKKVYYQLRQYWNEADLDSVSSHVSTRERLGSLDKFNNVISKHSKGVKNVVDVGSGVYPLIFPFEDFKELKSYTCIEQDRKACQKVEQFKTLVHNVNVDIFCESIGLRPWQQYLPRGIKRFDLALMLKLVPVVSRQDRKEIDFLAQIPASKIILTASRQSMTKKQDISHRERKKLVEFIEKINGEVVEEFETKDEIGFILQITD